MYRVSDSFVRFFAEIDEELNKLRTEINQTEGAWFLTRHRFSKKELLNESKMIPIRLMATKAASYYEAFQIMGQLSEADVETYSKLRTRMNKRIALMRRDIAGRKDLLADQILAFLESVMTTLKVIVPTANQIDKQVVLLLEDHR